MNVGLKNAHILVTGASGGIGIETTRLFLQQGALVSAHCNKNSGTLEPLITEHGNTLNICPADLTIEDDVIRMFQEARSKFGPVQILIVNHGIWPADDAPVFQMSLAQWNNTLNVNLTASFLVIREFLRQLADPATSDDQREKVAIILIGSTAGKYGEAGHADYACTKSAMMYGLTLSLKNEIVKIAPRGRVNCVAPGWVYTPVTEDALKNPDTVYRALATTPLKKVATPLDIANQIVIFASPTVSGHITGQVIMVEGGMEGRLLNKPEDISN